MRRLVTVWVVVILGGAVRHDGAHRHRQRPQGCRPSRSIRCGPNRCPITGLSAPVPASPSTHAITSGSSIGRRRCSRTRRARSGARRRRCSSSITQGNLVSSWGGPGDGYEWPRPRARHLRRPQDNVWIGGGGEKDAQILKFTRQGKFLMQIGRKGQRRGSNDTENLGAAANMTVDRDANELYVADGYVNHRVIVFDATTGAYKRHWGAYGKRPDDGYFTKAGETLPRPFSGAVQNENAEPVRSRRPAAAAVPHRPCRADRERRPRVRLRSHERSPPGVPQGRHAS